MSDQSGTSYGSTPGEGNEPTNPYGQPPNFQQPAYGMQQQKHSLAIAALVLGILGLVGCLFFAPVAWVLGRKSVREIDASGGALGGRGEAKAGQILGIIGTVIIVGVTLFVLGVFLFGSYFMETSP
ncbi:DUF4190 domain-containing protein [Nocardioides gilvus]|uniref:DUF4190 domain-containing protein n=1 Tax=Nocardioides gilvus TaxID=1735589 RepID=UPI00195211D9|nr:DUF4190 domain-containing protein [Nocardioides gilvus]